MELDDPVDLHYIPGECIKAVSTSHYLVFLRMHSRSDDEPIAAAQGMKVLIDTVGLHSFQDRLMMAAGRVDAGLWSEARLVQELDDVRGRQFTCWPWQEG